ncbi:MAG: sodium:proton antiporter [Myxococcales bacterium]|nr:sodium:proton antiporter [Myxococcales bacterium]
MRSSRYSAAAGVAAACWLLAAFFAPDTAWAASDAGHHGPGLGDVLPFWSILPFAGLLLSIAILPMVAEHWWHSNRNQLIVAVGWASPVFLWLTYTALTDHGTVGHDAAHGLEHAIEEYLSFIALLGSLYVISGGILLRGDLEGKPHVNTAFLAIGAVLSNVIGTTGASMLLIRPMLRTNAQQKHTWHIPLFFIFLVSNIGGALTPIGDPPLFLGYLRGIDFWWTLEHLWMLWAPVVVVLLVMFFFLDRYYYQQEAIRSTRDDSTHIEPLRLEGNLNFLWLAGVIACVLVLSPDPEVVDFRHYYAREIGMAVLTILSLQLTPRPLRAANDFTWTPILEVAALFIGIFVAMIPATTLLQANGASLGLTEPWQYFWATGMLSAFLDNAPTYVTFAAVACGTYEFCTTAENLAPLSVEAASQPILVAISLGAVFLGAGSYIGNGPNFMVRAIAEQSGYKMPSFFGYCGYALMFLGPVFVVLTLVALI